MDFTRNRITHAPAGRGLHVRPQVDTSRPIKGDAFLLQQALLNLLDNAVEFSPGGGEASFRIATV